MPSTGSTSSLTYTGSPSRASLQAFAPTKALPASQERKPTDSGLTRADGQSLNPRVRWDLRMWSKLFPCLLCPHPQPTKGNLTGNLHPLFQNKLFLPSNPDPSLLQGTPPKRYIPLLFIVTGQPSHPHLRPSWEGRLPQKWGLGLPGRAVPLTLHSMYCSMGEGRREKGGREKRFRASQQELQELQTKICGRREDWIFLPQQQGLDSANKPPPGPLPKGALPWSEKKARGLGRRSMVA